MLPTPAGTSKGRSARIVERRATGRRQIDREGLRPLVPPAVYRHRPGTVKLRPDRAKLAVSDVLLPTTTVLTVTPPPADGNRRRADDEVGARQRYWYRRASDALIG